MPVPAMVRGVRRTPMTRAARATSDSLPNWADVPPPNRRTCDGRCTRPSPRTAAILADLVSWVAEMAIRLINANPDDRAAIDQAARYARAWLAGTPTDSVRIEDVLTTVAAFAAELDRAFTRDTPETDEPPEPAVGS